MASPAIDYDALAKQHGGTAAVDYDALAREHGGVAALAPPPGHPTLGQRFMDLSQGAQDAAAHFTLGAYEMARKGLGLAGLNLPELSPTLRSYGETPAGSSPERQIGRRVEEIAPFFGPGMGTSLRAAGMAGAETEGNPVAMAAAAAVPALVKGGAKVVQGAKTLAGKLPSIDPDLVGIISPRAGNVLRKANRIVKALSPEEAAAAKIPTSPTTGRSSPVPSTMTPISPTLGGTGTAMPIPEPPAGATADLAALRQQVAAGFGKSYARMNPSERATVDTVVQRISSEAPVAPSIPSPPSAGLESPVQSVDPRTIGFERLQAAAKAKDIALAQRFTKLGLSPEQVAAMTEDQLNVHMKAENFQPFRGKHLSRSFAAGKTDIVKAMRALKSVPEIPPPPK